MNTSPNPTLPPNTGDTDWLDNAVRNIFEMGYRCGANGHKQKQPYYITEAKAAIAKKLVTARISELTMLDNNILEITPELFHDYYVKRVAELSGLQATKEN